MRVGQSGNNTVKGGDASAAKQSGRATSAHEAKNSERSSTKNIEKSPPHGARTEISAKSKDFAQAKAVASDAPDVRDERIAELKKRISEGAYKVDSDAISDRMVDEHLRMSDIG